MLGSPRHEYTTGTALQCAQDCLDDPLCHAFALYRDAEPAGGDVTCRRYDELRQLCGDDAASCQITLDTC